MDKMYSLMKLTLAALSLAFLSAIGLKPATARPACVRSKLFTSHGIIAWTNPSSPRVLFYKSGMAIDADGASRAYHPDDRPGLDSLDHAGHTGNWWALATDNGKPSGSPVVQRKSDPAPGYYVSTTALYDPNNPNLRDPHRYVDAAKIPYVVLPPKALKHAHLGDLATVMNLHNGRISAALVADESAPDLPFGEGSMALAKALGIDSSPRHGGQNGDVVYVIYLHSGNGRPRPLRDIVVESKRLFETWGGVDNLKACLADD